MEDLISVVVPVYNTGVALRRCVDSLVAQDYPYLEIILVDDGSEDEITLSICDEFENRYDNIRVIHQSNGGPSKARNTGIEASKGKYIAFVDSDDIVDSNTYSILHGFASQHIVSLVLGTLVVENGEGHSRNNDIVDDRIYSQREILSLFMLGKWHSACTNLYSREIIGDTRFPLNEINEDYIFNFWILLKIENAYVYSTPFYHYIKHLESRTGAPATLKHVDWLKHTQEVAESVKRNFGEALKAEAEYQELFANIILSNKCVLNFADGYKDGPKEIFAITTRNLRQNRKSILSNKFLSRRLKFMGIALSSCPALYKSLILTVKKLI